MNKVLRFILSALAVCLMCANSYGQSETVIPRADFEEINLYDGPIPNHTGAPTEEHYKLIGEYKVLHKISEPTLTICRPFGKASDAAVIICPGGGYESLWMPTEGYRTAHALNNLGITAFILKYRLPDFKFQPDPKIAPLQDAQQAIKYVRENAEKFGISPDKIGVMGFSAGSHLASTAGTHFNDCKIENVNETSLRPDFMILIYPLISFRRAISGPMIDPYIVRSKLTEADVHYLSTEENVTPQTPPTYMAHADDDALVTLENPLSFYQQLRKNKCQAEMHIYYKGQHGFSDIGFEYWFADCISWLKRQGFIK